MTSSPQPKSSVHELATDDTSLVPADSRNQSVSLVGLCEDDERSELMRRSQNNMGVVKLVHHLLRKIGIHKK